MTRSGRTRIWDVPTRVFHWSLPVLIAFAWWTYKTDRMDWHRIAGYALLASMVYRLLWGVFGSQTARFANFVRGPRAIWRYLMKGETTAGHNPLGGWSVILLLTVLVALTVLGLFVSDEDGMESGPLADYVTLDQAKLAGHLHGLAFNLLLAFVALHVAAVVFYFARGRNLLVPMLTGRGQLPAEVPAPVFAPVWAQLACLVPATATFLAFWYWGS